MSGLTEDGDPAPLEEIKELTQKETHQFIVDVLIKFGNRLVDREE